MQKRYKLAETSVGLRRVGVKCKYSWVYWIDAGLQGLQTRLYLISHIYKELYFKVR